VFFNRRTRIAVAPGYNNTQVDMLVVTQNSLEDFSNVRAFKADYFIGKKNAHLNLMDPKIKSKFR
jgi:hypothetical protein